MEKDYPSEAEKQDRPIAYSNSTCCCGRSWPNVRTLYLSLLMNVVFLALFVVVFIKLDSVQTQISRMESTAETNSKPVFSEPGTRGSLDTGNGSAEPNLTTSPTSSEPTVHHTLLKVRRLDNRKYLRKSWTHLLSINSGKRK